MRATDNLVKHKGQFNRSVNAILTAQKLRAILKLEDPMSGERESKTPGTTVKSAMDALGWGQADLAYVLGTTTAAINQILSNKRAISHNMAKALAVALNLDPEALVRLQAEWDLRKAENPDPAVAVRAKIFSRYPLREMARRGWIDPEHPSKSVEAQICEFFDVQSLEDVPHLAHSAKRTNYDDISAPQLAWLFRVRQIAKEMHNPVYSQEKLLSAINSFRDFRIEPEAVRHVPRTLNEAGVRFAIVEALPNSKIDGVCFWLDDRSPVIGLSMRFDRIDNFWFVLRHECSHVIHGHGKESAIVDVELESAISINDEEEIANRDAADFCVQADKMKSFIDRKKPFFSERDVLAFSEIQKVHPGIVVGQIQRAVNRYDLLRKYLVPVRKSLALATMMDGWGDMIPTQR